MAFTPNILLATLRDIKITEITNGSFTDLPGASQQGHLCMVGEMMLNELFIGSFHADYITIYRNIVKTILRSVVKWSGVKKLCD